MMKNIENRIKILKEYIEDFMTFHWTDWKTLNKYQDELKQLEEKLRNLKNKD